MVQTSLTAWLQKPSVENNVSTVSVDEIPAPLRAKNDTPNPKLAASPPYEKETQLLDQGVRTPAKKEQNGKIFRPIASYLPPNVELCSISAGHLRSFRRLNTLMLPVPYTDRFYDEILNDPLTASISRVALWHDPPTSESQNSTAKPRVVAGIRCRLLQCSPSESLKATGMSTADRRDGRANSPSLYISTIVTLAPFRHHGLAKALLSTVTAQSIEDYGIKTVSAHVWEANTEGRRWYAKQGFKEVVFEDKYYKRLKPDGAWIVERPVTPLDLLGVKPAVGEPAKEAKHDHD